MLRYVPEIGKYLNDYEYKRYLLRSKSTGGLYLYHATNADYVDSIIHSGLSATPTSHNWDSDNMLMNKGVYLALDAKSSIRYGKESSIPNNKIVLFRIPYTSLDDECFEYDWNNRCEYRKDINSCLYTKDIPAGYLELVADYRSEPRQNINSFEGTKLYDILLDTFEYEVETNLEDGED